MKLLFLVVFSLCLFIAVAQPKTKEEAYNIEVFKANGKEGLKNVKTGEIYLPAEYESVSRGNIIEYGIKTGGKEGLYNIRFKKIVVPPIYTQVTAYTGKSAYDFDSPFVPRIEVMKNGKYG